MAAVAVLQVSSGRSHLRLVVTLQVDFSQPHPLHPAVALLAYLDLKTQRQAVPLMVALRGFLAQMRAPLVSGVPLALNNPQLAFLNHPPLRLPTLHQAVLKTCHPSFDGISRSAPAS